MLTTRLKSRSEARHEHVLQRDVLCVDSSGRVAGVVIGIILFIGVIALTVWCCCFRKGGAVKGKILHRSDKGEQIDPQFSHSSRVSFISCSDCSCQVVIHALQNWLVTGSVFPIPSQFRSSRPQASSVERLLGSVQVDRVLFHRYLFLSLNFSSANEHRPHDDRSVFSSTLSHSSCQWN